MENSKTLSLINKLIKKTKDSSIHWEKYSSSDYHLKPLPSSPLESTLTAAMVTLASYTSKNALLIDESSYVSSYDDGIFFLLLYRSSICSSIIELRVQTKSSENSKICASSASNGDDVIIAAQLKRLYNLIDSEKHSVEIDSFIDHFLMNE